jgi:four helix bundle protein
MRFEEMRVWKEAVAMAHAIYGLQIRDANLRDQMRRAATSVAANIAEGAGAGSDAEFARFARYARRSCDEIRAHLALAVIIGVTADTAAILAAAERTGKMLTRLIQALAPPP